VANIKIWGRTNSGNVKKALVVADELGIPYERIDAGMAFGVVDTPEYRKMNPNGRIPTLQDGELTLWESNSVCRYLCMQYGGERIYPAAPGARANIDRWLDWQLSTVIPVDVPAFWGTIRTAPEKHDKAAIAENGKKLAAVFGILDAQLSGRKFITGDAYALCDLVLGIFAHRYMANPFIEHPAQPNLKAWYERMLALPVYKKHVDFPLD
jgi:glutathione S-transferase